MVGMEFEPDANAIRSNNLQLSEKILVAFVLYSYHFVSYWYKITLL